MKCDIIIYSNEAAVGLTYFPKYCPVPIVMFKMWAKTCASNNYLCEWQAEALSKILKKGKYYEADDSAARCCMYECSEGYPIEDDFIKPSYEIYKNHFSMAKDYFSDNLYTDKAQKNLKKEIKKLMQAPTHKSLLFRQVHCVKYLKRVRAKYYLERNERDSEWYYRQIGKEEKNVEKARGPKKSWKHNMKYDLKEREFSGVVVKIEVIPFSTLLGVNFFMNVDCNDNVYFHDNRGCYVFEPAKKQGFTIPVATVFYQNGRKRLVPLTCIKEYEGFCNGANIERVIKNIEEVENFGSKNLITQKEDGSIEIENSFLYLDTDFNVNKANRKLVLDVANRTSLGDKTTDEMFIKISDEEYKSVLDMMKEQMKQECGFEPKLVYGETNYDRLVNFANCPFAPELNAFSQFFKEDYRLENAKENYSKDFAPPTETWEDMAHSPDCVRKFIRLYGLPYTPKVNKIFLSGHRHFAKLIGICQAGFRDERAIDLLMRVDEKFIFETIIFQRGFFYNYIQNGEAQVCFALSSEVNLFKNIKFLFKYYDEMTCAKLTAELLKQEYNDSRAMDALEYMKNLAQENNMSAQIVRKIGHEGFTRYNHDMLMRVYRQAHPEQKEQFENLSIEYSAEEKQLEWEKDGYKFCLPEDTNRLVDIGYKMNICVGHLYREKAAQKKCDIVYTIKNDEYELCVELRKTADNRFEVVQKSAFSNREPKGKLLAAYNSWRAAKNVG